MQPFRIHVLACDQQKPEGVPGCRMHGAPKVVDALRAAVGRAGLADEVLITVTGSMGVCDRGPNLVVYPEGVWYSGVGPDDVAEIVEDHFRDGRPVERLMNRDEDALRAEIRMNRDRAFAAMRARETSGMLPDDLEETIRGYQESRILLSAIEMDLFSAVGEGNTAEEIATEAKADLRGVAILLDALTAMGLVTKSHQKYSLAPVAERFLTVGAEHDSRVALMHHASLWRRWSNLTEIVKEGHGSALEEAPGRSAAFTRAFIALMHRNAIGRAPLVVGAVGASSVRRMLDIGGGSGAYSIAFAQANPSLEAEVLDLTDVLPIAREHIREAGLEERVTVRAGDLRSDHFGSGYDLILLSAVCHMLGAGENRNLVRRAFAALAPGGRLVVQDFILDPDRTSPRFAALFSVNMLVSTERGRDYTEEEYTGWMREAGFAQVTRSRLPGPTDLIIGTA
jgi:(2Fe-2S) ferredoxin/predicted O-methyltransferase YrrM